MPNDEEVRAVAPHRLFLGVGPGSARGTLVAATEGETRFVASAPGEPGLPHEQVASASHWLTAQCGYAVSTEMIDAVVVRGAPLRVGLIGACSAADESAVRSAERSGLAHISAVPGTPPRHAVGQVDWARSLLHACQRGVYDALMIVTPPGSMPAWLAQLLSGALAATENDGTDLLIVATDGAISPVLPTCAQLLIRGASLPSQLADALTVILARRVTASAAPPAPLLAHMSALAAGLAFAASELREPVAYLDVSIGTTVMIARGSDVEILFDPDGDCATGAVAVLERVGAEHLSRWIPFPIAEEALRHWAIRRVCRPRALPVEATDRAIAAGFARAALSALIANSPTSFTDCTRCIVGPGVLEWSAPVEAMCFVADVLRGVRIANLAADPDDLLPIVGALAMHAPDSARSLLSHDLLTDIGTLIALPMNAQRAAMSAVAIAAEGDRASRVTIATDTISRIRLPSPRSVRVIFRDGREETLAMAGHSGNFLIDTRARPLVRIGIPDEARASVSARLRPLLESEEVRHG